MTLTPTQRRRSLLGVIAAMAVVNLVYGISFPLMALVLDAQGVSKSLIGLNTVSQAVAIFFIAVLAPRVLQRHSPARVMQLSALLVAALLLLAGWFPNVWFWFPLRFVIGGLTAMLWIASEALINQMAEEHRRGRVIGVYSAVGAAGFALGPLLLALAGSDGMLPFVLASAILVLAALPLFLVHSSQGEAEEQQKAGLWRVFLLAPAIMLVNLVYAASAESMITFFPLFGISLGLEESASLALLTVMGLGGMVLVLPLGWLADRVPRMGLLLGCVVLTLAGLLAMPAAVQAGWLFIPYIFVFGGIEGMIYTLGVILVGERFKGALLATATAVFTTCWAAGTVLGPAIVGAGMDAFGDRAMAQMIAVMLVLYLPFLVFEMRRGQA